MGTNQSMGEDPRLSIVLATYNERENILDMIESIFAHVQDTVEIIVVDDNSPDGTWEIAGSLGDPRIKVVRRVNARGLASAINRGIIETRGEIIGWMDSDMCHPPTLLPDMIEKLKAYDVVIGSRYVPGGEDDREALRVLPSRLINGLAGLVLGYGIKDYDSGFIVLKREVLDSVSLIPTGYGAYFIEFIYSCCKKGLGVLEIPFAFHEREKGTSKSNPGLFDYFTTGMGYVIRIFAARFRKLD
jgi:dolichol-phosphate mannosyltransferase